MSTESTGASRVRASDAEREEYARLVREAVTEGRLSLSEGDERLATVYAAVYRDELAPTVSDLPRQGSTWGRPGPRRTREEPDNRPPAWVGFGRHASFVLVVAAILITIWAVSSAHFFWPAIPLAFLAIGLFKHGMWTRWGGRRSWR